MIDLKNLKKADDAIIVSGTAEFRNLRGRAYSMEENHGVSFSFEGGKFSARVPAELASGLGEDAVEFSRVVFAVTPGTFGREKRAGFKVGEILILECSGKPVYRSALAGPDKPEAGK